MKTINPDESALSSTTNLQEKSLEHNKLRKINEKSKLNMEIDLKDILSVDHIVYELIISKYDDLKNLFKLYSKIGDKAYTYKIELTSFLRFIKDLELMEQPKDLSLSQSSAGMQTLAYPNKNTEMTTASPIKRPLNTSMSTAKMNKGLMNETDMSLIFFNLTGNTPNYYYRNSKF